jgi:twitching motility protein PilT
VPADQARQLASQLVPEWERKNIDKIRDYDCSWGAPGVGRFRVNIFRQRGTMGIVMRVIPIEIPTLEEMNLPAVLSKIADNHRGMVLVTGVTGSGKSTTLAAMLNHINETRSQHILTLEDPIEFLHKDKKSSLTQREIGTDTESFGVGLRAALREDPDTVLVGEMRDTETIDIALKAAETGHLLFSTLHTQNAVKTISRIIAVFPPEEQEMVRVRLAESIIAVISQRLLPRKDGNGRVAAVEVMLATSTIRDLILEPERTDEIADLIAEGREQYGSQTFDQHLADLVKEDRVSFEVAKAAASNPSDFELKMRTLA